MNRSYDGCQTCGSRLPGNEFALAGYGASGEPMYVGLCCKELLTEVATPVYWWWEPDKRCDPKTRLWRYMDLAKFIALIDSRSLHFARADLLGDSFEGATGNMAERARWDAFYLDSFRQAVRTAPGRESPLSDEEVDAQANRLLKGFSQSAITERRQLYVSCWHASPGESEALWRIYCPPPTAGVAIETTADRLLRSVGRASVRLGKVRYLDFRTEYAGVHDRIFCKRKSLSHESEVRLVTRRLHSSPPKGWLSPVDLSTLVVSIVPSPFAPEWFVPLLQSLLLKYEASGAVVRSEISAEPFF